MPRRKVRRRAAPKLKPPPSPEEERRELALIRTRKTKADVRRRARELGADVSHATVSYVIEGQFQNADVARAFCDVTGTEFLDMWPEYRLSHEDMQALLKEPGERAIVGPKTRKAATA
jgi:hypothetical protein